MLLDAVDSLAAETPVKPKNLAVGTWLCEGSLFVRTLACCLLE
jgi:hypothetical protein